jgi:hypothetical protein
MGILTSLSKSAISTALHVSEVVLLVFGVLLTAGLIGEYVERWKKWAKLFLMLVIIGVAGELIADGGIFLFSRQLETIAELQIAGLNKQAGDAWNAAESAKATAKGFESQIADANARAKSAEAQVASANAASRDAVAKVSTAEARIAEATARAAEAGQKAEAERLERLKLEAIVAPRSLSLDQQHEIAEACRKFHGHGVLVFSYGQDGEAAALGGQIISALQSVHIVVADARSSAVITGGFETGVHVSGPKVEHEFVSVLGDALSRIGKLKAGGVVGNGRPGSALSGGGEGFPAGTTFVTVTVGVKPVPVLPSK